MMRITNKKKWINILGIFIGFPILCFAIITIIISVKKDVIVQELLATANEDFKGKIALSETQISPFENFPYVSIDLKDFQVYETKNPNEKPIINLKDVYVGFDLWTIIQGKFDIKTIKLSNGKINITQYQDNSFNIVKAFETEKEVDDMEEEFHVDLQKIVLRNVDILKTNLADTLTLEAFIDQAETRFKKDETFIKMGLNANFVFNIIKDNFINDISVLKSTPVRNKSYTSTQEKKIEKIIENEPILSVFIKLISYNFLRPVEVCRLKVKDIDIVDKKIYVRAKNQAVKTKIIPDIMIKELPDLTQLDPNSLFITPYGFGAEWNATETSRRNGFSDLFRERFKNPLKLGDEYGLYSFRHTYITKLYKELAKTSTPFEAKSKLMLITGHASMTALEKYLREIDAVLPDDYSNMLG